MKPGTPQRKADRLEPHQASEDFSSRLVEGSPDCIKVLDLDGRLLSMNTGGMRALEICDLAPLVGCLWMDFWEGADREAAQAAVETARHGGIGRFVGFFATTQTKTPKWWHVIVSPILGTDGRPEKLLASSRDVTEWKRTERLLDAIIAGTSAVTGTEFFRSLVQNLAPAITTRTCKACFLKTNHSWKCRRKVIWACRCATPLRP